VIGFGDATWPSNCTSRLRFSVATDCAPLM
jgi:hypothetical protein